MSVPTSVGKNLPKFYQQDELEKHSFYCRRPRHALKELTKKSTKAGAYILCPSEGEGFISEGLKKFTLWVKISESETDSCTLYLNGRKWSFNPQFLYRDKMFESIFDLLSVKCHKDLEWSTPLEYKSSSSSSYYEDEKEQRTVRQSSVHSTGSGDGCLPGIGSAPAPDVRDTPQASALSDASHPSFIEGDHGDFDEIFDLEL